jgi:hypothetical protein
MIGTRFKLDSKLKLEAGDDDGINVVIDTHSGVISSCNSSAALLLERLQSGATLDDLVTDLTATFLIPQDQAEADASDFIRRLSAMGLINEHA